MKKEQLAIQKWGDKYIQICLSDEIYPNDEIPQSYLIATKPEIRRMIALTKRRTNHYNKIKPKDWAGY